MVLHCYYDGAVDINWLKLVILWDDNYIMLLSYVYNNGFNPCVILI